ncbi:MAG: carboxypeptidase regulatory-like domain-containing protein [Acidobacteriota bacterium]
MTLAILAMLPLLLDGAGQAAQPRAKTPPAATTTATITVTDLSGAPLRDVRVNLTGALDRSGSTQADGTVRFDTLRAGTYRLRLAKDGFVLLERELEWRSGQPPPTPSVALTPAEPPPAPPPPPAPEPPKTALLPPPGIPVSMSVPDFIEKNFISSSQPQKVSDVGCSGLVKTVLWQVREPWENRSHASADAMLYVIGGEGALRLEGRETSLKAGSFASVPRGSTYGLVRRGRNPLIVLATLAGEPCAP